MSIMMCAMKYIQTLGHDHPKLPMQWDSALHGGVTAQKDGVWMRTHDLYMEINVAAQVDQPGSVLSFWTNMLKVRRERKNLFIHGIFEGFDLNARDTFVFGKKLGESCGIVALNFTGEEQSFQKLIEGELQLLVSNLKGAEAASDKLMPFEGRIYLAD